MSTNSLSLHFLKEHPKDAARTLEEVDPEALALYLESVPAKTAANVIKYIVPSISAECLKLMAIDKSSQIVMLLGVERASLLLRRMKSGIRVQFIRAMSPVFSNMTRLVLRYPEGTVGQVMNPNVFTVHQDMTVNQVINVIKNTSQLLHNEIFITNDKQQLAGIVDARVLLTADGNQAMKTIMKPPGKSIPARASLDSIKNYPEWHYKENFPVIDHMGIFIGVLSRSSIHEVLEDEEKLQNQDEFTSTALAVAELFWDACSDLLAPGHENIKKGHQDERNQ
jgi:magnesium transporter